MNCNKIFSSPVLEIFLSAILIFICSNIFCIKQATKQTTVITELKPPTFVMEEGDTTVYVLGFPDENELDGFLNKFDQLIENYSYDTITTDTIGQYFRMSILKKTEKKDSILLDSARSDTSETDTSIPEKTEEIPVFGGKATIYTDRQFMDNTLSDLILAIPFPFDSAEDTISDTAIAPINKKLMENIFLSVNQVSPVTVTVECKEQFARNKGKSITAFDLAKTWTKFIKKHPVDGSALFYNVKGVREFIKGEEAIIRGFIVKDENTIQITMNGPAPDILKRLNSPYLLPPSFTFGSYYVHKKENQRFLLKRNNRSSSAKAFLDQCIIICGNDKSPLISYSLGKYDVVLLYKMKDVEYARRSMLEKANLVPFSTERYFISLGSNSLEKRRFLRNIVQPRDLQKYTVRANSKLIYAIESDDQITIPEKTDSGTGRPELLTPVCILFNSGDPVSTTIANKIYSDFTHSGIKSKLSGLTGGKLEYALFNKEYDIAIGWVSEDVLTNEIEQMYLASAWFNDIRNENERINKYFEIPLFTVNWFALCKMDVKFHKNRITGIYRDIQQSAEEQ